MNESYHKKLGGGGGGGRDILLIPNKKNKTDVLYLTGRTEDFSKSVTDSLVEFDRNETAKND